MPDRTGFTRVSMLELDRSLSRILRAAQRLPVSVHRYGAPWVWMVSHDAWLKTSKPRVGLPEQHPLTVLRHHLDTQMQQRHRDIDNLADALAPEAHPQLLVRAALLRRLYAIESLRFLVEQLRHNTLFAAFVGIDPPFDDLALTLRLERLYAAAGTAALLDALLERAPLHRFVDEFGLRIPSPPQRPSASTHSSTEVAQ
jgi:transposase